MCEADHAAFHLFNEVTRVLLWVPVLARLVPKTLLGRGSRHLGGLSETATCNSSREVALMLASPNILSRMQVELVLVNLCSATILKKVRID